MAVLTQRAAALGDLKDIWGLLRHVASDIPFKCDDAAAQENMLTEIMACCTSGLSPIALDENKAIVGALLVRRDDFEWGFRNSKAVHIAYAAIAPSHRGQDILGALVSEVQERKVPVFVSVKSGGQLGFAEALEGLGFAHECTAVNGWGELYKWQPGPAH